MLLFLGLLSEIMTSVHVSIRLASLRLVTCVVSSLFIMVTNLNKACLSWVNHKLNDVDPNCIPVPLPVAHHNHCVICITYITWVYGFELKTPVVKHEKKTLFCVKETCLDDTHSWLCSWPLLSCFNSSLSFFFSLTICYEKLKEAWPARLWTNVMTREITVDSELLKYVIKNCPPNSCILQMKRQDTWLLKNLKFVQIECYFAFLSNLNFLFLGYITQKHWCLTDTYRAVYIDIQPGRYFNGSLIATLLFVAHEYVDWKKVVIAYICNWISVTLLLLCFILLLLSLLLLLWNSCEKANQGCFEVSL